MVERRRAPRFTFRQPVLLKIQQDHSWREVKGVTQNTSAVGVYLTTDAPVAVGAEVEVAITMPHGIQACTSGRVVRVIGPLNDGKIELAVECTRPFSEVR
jgi:hypothetical protein